MPVDSLNIALIGLDDLLKDKVRDALPHARRHFYPMPPTRMWSQDGRVFLPHPTKMHASVIPQGVVFYGYFEDAQDRRLALAMSGIPTYPDIRRAIRHDDKMLSLLQAEDADPAPLEGPRRGLIPQGVESDCAFTEKVVFKWGHRHCGDNKVLGWTAPSYTSLVEPFVDGTSERILIVGDMAWHLLQEGPEWRKNVRGTVRESKDPDEGLIRRSRVIAERLGLEVVGIDYVRPSGGGVPVLLEVNTYPELSPEAEDEFARQVQKWARQFEDRSSMA